jgi:hypothetical protein
MVVPPPAVLFSMNSVQSTLAFRPARRRQSFCAFGVNTTTIAPRSRTILTPSASPTGSGAWAPAVAGTASRAATTSTAVTTLMERPYN